MMTFPTGIYEDKRKQNNEGTLLIFFLVFIIYKNIIFISDCFLLNLRT